MNNIDTGDWSPNIILNIYNRDCRRRVWYFCKADQPQWSARECFD